jgi:hypothetical protein
MEGVLKPKQNSHASPFVPTKRTQFKHGCSGNHSRYDAKRKNRACRGTPAAECKTAPLVRDRSSRRSNNLLKPNKTLLPRHLCRRREPKSSTVVPAIIRATIQNERTGPRKIAGERQQNNANTAPLARARSIRRTPGAGRMIH